MSWNYRIMASIGGDHEVYFDIHEVHYDKGIAKYYSDEVPVGGELTGDIEHVLSKMLKATSKPILWTGDRFPEEYKE